MSLHNTNELKLAELADELTAEAAAVAQMSMFNQPSAIKAMLPNITGLIKQLCATVDSQAVIIAKQQEQIKKLTGGY